MRILYVTTISLTMNSFFKKHIEMLVSEGHEVDIACNYKELPLDQQYYDLGCSIYQVDFSRQPFSSDNIRAYSQLKAIVKNGEYGIVHCHTPNAAVITRLVCRGFRKNGIVKVFYTAHGFHFYKGAPILNWLIYYPVEKLCSYFTDKLITINSDDYDLAKKKFKAKKICYVPGVGVDLSKFKFINDKNLKIRQDLGIPEESILLLSVGELNENKNHQIVIKAISEMKNSKIHYVIAGVGNLKSNLQDLAASLNVGERVHFLGYRNDIADLHKASDVYVLPSIREGLNVSLIEAMASGLPCIAGKIRGNVDLIDDNGGELFDPFCVDSCVAAVEKVINGDLVSMGKYNSDKAKLFGVDPVLQDMRRIYGE